MVRSDIDLLHEEPIPQLGLTRIKNVFFIWSETSIAQEPIPHLGASRVESVLFIILQSVPKSEETINPRNYLRWMDII